MALFDDANEVSAGKQVFLPGRTTSGHYQIELACAACHQPFQGVRQEACLDCHGEALQAVEDSHSNKKFLDPRNADKLEVMDATRCVTCHREHRPELVHAMDVSVPDDFCFECHADVAQERPSHQGMEAAGCAAAGCHNYHDNQALYEDFLAAHLHEPDTRPEARLPARNLGERLAILRGPAKPLTAMDQDAPAGLAVPPDLLEAWAETAHARSGVNCTACHEPKDTHGQRRPWQDHVDLQACRECHQDELRGFLAGKHGMRLARGLPAMTPGMARLPMQAKAHDKTLGCTGCHDVHAFDTRRAAVDACMGCHDDDHSRAYRPSPHYRLWQAETEGRGEPGSGVSCATCHLPRSIRKRQGRAEVWVDHNQSFNLHPNEKMIRSICLSCHGLGFSIDALADSNLVKNNFNGKPTNHVKSIDMAEARLRSRQHRKARSSSGSVPEQPAIP